MTILEAAAALRAKKVSSRELTAECLRIIDAGNGAYNAFLNVTGESALREAAAFDSELERGIDRGPLHGIPIALKDLFCTRGVATTCASLLYKDFVPDYDCTVWEKLSAAGCVMLGKAHQHELAYGVTSNNPHYGAVRNPWNVERVPGGSSGGSGAAVTAGMAFMAMGSDTGGSIRVPAAFCNTFGLKPAFGRVSKFGVLPLGYTLDHMGPLTRSARDAAVCLQVMAGRDDRDETTSFAPVDDYLPSGAISLKGVRIGVPSNYYFDRVDPDAANAARKMIAIAASLGATIVDVTVPDIAALNTVARIILLCEAATVLNQFAGREHEAGADIRVLWEQGLLLPATEYINAQRLRRHFRDAFLRLFDSVDVLATPTTPTGAKKIGDATVTIEGVEEDFRLATTRFMRGINVLGFPATSQPCGFDGEGMPLGLQLIARPFAEKRLLEVAAALEDATDFHRHTPPNL